MVIRWRKSAYKFLFGDRKKLKISALAGSLFEPCEEVCEVELLRNLLIHDWLLDDMLKAYEVIKDGVAVERFVLMPVVVMDDSSDITTATASMVAKTRSTCDCSGW